MNTTPIYKNQLFQIVSAINLLGFMMVGLVSPAYPKMIQVLGIPTQSIGLMTTAVTIPSILLGPLTGIMADRLGRKKVLIPSIFLFGIAGGGCAFTDNFNVILILRFLQGVGGAGLFNTALVILMEIFTGHKRTEALGLSTAINYFGYIVYPLLGGALASLSWNYTFLPLFLALPVGIMAQLSLNYHEPRYQQTIKAYLGDSLKYLKSVNIIWVLMASIIAYVILHGSFLVYFVILLGERFHANPFTIGLYISLFGIATALISSQMGKIGRRFPPSLLIVIGASLFALCMIIIPLIPHIALLLIPTVILGIAAGLVVPNFFVAASNSAPPEQRAGLLAIYGGTINFGMTIGPLVIGLIYTLSGLNLNTTFMLSAVIALIIPITALLISRKKLPLK